MKRSTWVAAPMVLLLLTACTGGPGSIGPGSSAAGATNQPLDLAGTWVLQRGAGPGGEVPIPADGRVTLIFDGNQVGGQACNHYGGEYQLAGNAIRIGSMSMTEMACQEPLMSAEAAYHAALAAATRIARDGDTLTLRGDDGTELVYTLAPPVPDAALNDTRWILESLVMGDAVASVQGEATLELGSDGSIQGSTGCRGFSGDYVVNGDQVVATTLGADETSCEAQLAQQDAHVLQVIGDGFLVELDGDRLTLSDPDGNGLVYRAANR